MPALGEYSEVAICNLALAEMGRGAEIVSLDEPSQAARACARRFPYARDAVLRSFDWNFAARRASLPALATAPAFGRAAAFAVPSDCLLVRKVQDLADDAWEIEARTILADAPAPLRITYTARITNPVFFDVLFTDALVTRLAADLAVQLADSPARATSLHQLFREKLVHARTRDTDEGTTPRDPRSPWLDARFEPGFVPL
ncbi:MAG: hypothetical protein ACK59B_02905 [Alphaproteobacteria bacterium]